MRARQSVAVELANETYASDQHSITQPPFAIHLTEARPRERRQRIVVAFRRDAVASRTQLTVRSGAERVANVSFMQGATRLTALMQEFRT